MAETEREHRPHESSGSFQLHGPPPPERVNLERLAWVVEQLTKELHTLAVKFDKFVNEHADKGVKYALLKQKLDILWTLVMATLTILGTQALLGFGGLIWWVIQRSLDHK